MEDLDAKFPGLTTIMKTWFASYKGRDKDGNPNLYYWPGAKNIGK